MFLAFFTELRAAKVPVTLREYLTLIDALDQDLAEKSVEDFYYLSRACSGERRAQPRQVRPGFRPGFQGPGKPRSSLGSAEIPEEWLRKVAERYLTEEEKSQIEAMGGWEKLMETLKERLKEQKGRHQGGYEVDRHRRHLAVRRLRLQPGRHPHRPGRQPQLSRREGLGQARVQGPRRHGRARHAQHQGRAAPPAPLRPRRARPRSSTSTAPSRARRTRAISTSSMRPERHNAVKVLLFLDVGGSMDWHVKTAEELFSAARTEFKHLEYFYFHNCLYERVWKDNRRRRPSARRPGTCCTPTRPTIRSCSSATRR